MALSWAPLSGLVFGDVARQLDFWIVLHTNHRQIWFPHSDGSFYVPLDISWCENKCHNFRRGRKVSDPNEFSNGRRAHLDRENCNKLNTDVNDWHSRNGASAQKRIFHSPGRVKIFPHKVHGNCGIVFSCLLMCHESAPATTNVLPHTAHMNGCTLLWMR